MKPEKKLNELLNEAWNWNPEETVSETLKNETLKEP